jgi:hypothetical protein
MNNLRVCNGLDGSIPTAPTITPDDSVALTLLGRVKRRRKSGILFPSCSQLNGVNPLDGTNYLDTVSAFIEGFLHLLAGEGVWGRGRHLSPFPQ